ncbi:MAG: FAD-dependent oxidoreductase, partial [Flavobacteriales bacterium]
MINHKYDVIVVGVGSMGAATCYSLAARGVKVLGLEQFNLVHENGSHAGQSRMVRKAYFEHPDYVPLLEKTYALWSDLEEKTGKKLFHKSGL